MIFIGSVGLCVKNALEGVLLIFILTLCKEAVIT